MKNFKIGDIVTVLDGRDIDNYYGGWIRYLMNPLIGKQFEICDIYTINKAYRLKSLNTKLDKQLTQLTSLVFDERGLELYQPKKRCVEFKYKGDKTIAIVLENDKYINHGNSICNQEDTYDRELGEKIAICRAFGITSDFVNEYVDKPKSEKVKEVSRIAKVGEYVKIVDANCQDGYYKNGDILKIVEAFNGLDSRFYKNELGKFLYDFEYVVLEGYEPEK